MMFPTLHLNGTSYDELYRQLSEACSAINDAIAKVEEATPNSRDYYVKGDAAMPSAMREHVDRVRRLVAVKNELFSILEDVDRQQSEREAIKAGAR
jgi:hypothetical protein